MPEGDTIHTLAVMLGRWLTGRQLTAVRVPRQTLPQLGGCRVQCVTSHGKHLYIDLDDGHRLRSHLGLYGAWHHYGRDEPWQKPPGQASLVLELEDRVYVCFNAREVELMWTLGFQALDQHHRLGPDLIRELVQPEPLWERARDLLAGDTPVVDLLLNQRVAAGIGNVYKSEVLFIGRYSPLLRLDDLSSEDMTQLYSIAGSLLNENLHGGRRRTRWPDDGRGPLWVYGRAARPCLRCGGSIRRDLLGRYPRSTYWCAACQTGPAAATAKVTGRDAPAPAYSNRSRNALAKER
ncbi:DNA-formamidopyrimidine glycosylase family protein [uncultured Thiodictyon sp.]|jgi:endonuclease-8|uniref:DNA-formamidopyrimidine glycosylase family protein n=1 Tax=uncultured Thiodictyon sp. TaxID=1846217 RepID=UPI0025FF41EA|nr:DNA-formamidopyrimidine glycosylase family protein [uncultured Thiodictyon sp.]